MASRHSRIGVARDPELERALELTRPLLDASQTRSQAAHVHALALRGAEAVMDLADPQAQLRRRLLEKYEATSAHGDLLDLPQPDDEVDPDDPTPASDALRWVRGEDREH